MARLRFSDACGMTEVKDQASVRRHSGAMNRLTEYAVLVVALTLPFWLAGALVDTQLMPGLPIAALAVFVPTLAAAIVLASAEGRATLAILFRRAAEIRRLPLWGYLFAATLPAGIAGVGWYSLYLRGEAVHFVLPAVAVVPLAVLLIGAALLEEFGWTGFATDRLSARFGLVRGALVLGLGWAVWHYPTLVEAHRGVAWIAWWTVWTVSQRVAMVSLYKRTGSNLWAPVIFHASANLVWQLAPDAFDPMFQGLAAGAVAVALMLARPRE